MSTNVTGDGKVIRVELDGQMTQNLAAPILWDALRNALFHKIHTVFTVEGEIVAGLTAPYEHEVRLPDPPPGGKT